MAPIELPAQQDNTSTLQDTEEENDYQTGSERVTKAMESNTSHGTDATIRKIAQHTTPDNIEFPADLRKIKKPEPQFEEIQTTTKRSKEFPSFLQKALEMLQYQEWHDKIGN